MTRIAADPLPNYPIAAKGGTGPVVRRIVRAACRLSGQVALLCGVPPMPGGPGQAVDPGDSSTWLEYAESSYELDEQRTALIRHLAHHLQLDDPTAALPSWTWSDQLCPRCHAPAEDKCFAVARRPSTTVHAARWQDHSDRYW